MTDHIPTERGKSETTFVPPLSLMTVFVTVSVALGTKHVGAIIESARIVVTVHPKAKALPFQFTAFPTVIP